MLSYFRGAGDGPMLVVLAELTFEPGYHFYRDALDRLLGLWAIARDGVKAQKDKLVDAKVAAERWATLDEWARCRAEDPTWPRPIPLPFLVDDEP
jgi:hypothetical protein